MNSARRFVGLAILLFFALPFGLSVTGCGHKSAPVVFCTAQDTGPEVGQAFNIVLSSSLATTGESLNYGQIGTPLSASATDCKGNPVSVKSFTYSSTSSFSVNAVGGAIFADINPANGTVCGGTWNRNTGGNIADFTTCTPPASTPVSTSAISLSTPTAPTATAGSSSTLLLGQATDTVSGTLSLALGAGAPVSFAVTQNTSLAQLAGQINSAAAQPGSAIAGTTATVTTGNTQFLTITGPAGAANNLVTTGTALVDSTSFFLATVTAEADGVTSNGVAVYVHPIATGVVLGGATPGVMNGSCPAGTVDPGTDCCPNDTVGTPIVAPVYTGTPSGAFPLGCASQNQVGQLVARVYANGTTTPANNITCQVGHLTFGAQTSGIVSIDQNGAATAEQPGSTTITATISNSSSATNAGYFSTCPPAAIKLADPNSSSNSINVAVNTLQPLTATVLDTQGNPITGLSLEFNSTTPQTIPPAIGSVTPLFPGSADITAVCQPASCNPAPFNQIGLYGNGKAITSNPITIIAPGTSSTVVYMGSTSSDYVAFKDFTTNETSALIKLPYVPNSMVMNQSGTDIYMGSTQGLMTLALTGNTVSAVNQSIPGVVLGVSPDGSTIVVTDPTRQTISLVSAASNAVTTSYGGIGTSATWSPDTQAVYITTATLSSTANPAALTATPTITPSSTVTPSPVILTHSPYTDWQTATADHAYTDAIVAVPSIGAFFAGPNTTDGRSYCPSSTITATGNPSVVSNQFLPLAGQAAITTDQLAATTNGSHILGAHAVTGGSSTFTDIDLVLPTNTGTGTGNDVGAACPMTVPTDYFQTSLTTQPLAGVNAGTITGVFASSNSAAAFVTYTPPAANLVTNALLPLYIPPATGQGTLQYITLSNGATQNAAPESGVFSTDNFTFYVGTGSSDGTAADNDVHLITLTYPGSGAPTATEAPGSTITPQLPLAGGSGYAPVNLIAQHPKKTTS